MAQDHTPEESQPLTKDETSVLSSERSSVDSASTTSLILESLGHKPQANGNGNGNGNGNVGKPKHEFAYKDNEDDVEEGIGYTPRDDGQPADKRAVRVIWLLAIVATTGWIFAIASSLAKGSYKHPSSQPYDHDATTSKGAGKKITLDQVMGGEWLPSSHSISWIPGADGEDALLLEQGQPDKDFLVVEDVRSRDASAQSTSSKTLMKEGQFEYNGGIVFVSRVWPSPDLNRVLVMSEEQHNWRHSYTGKYWIYDVKYQRGQPLDPEHPNDRIQLATWAPNSRYVVFTRDNNMFLRQAGSQSVKQITKDGGANLFYGVPDWVYEEEVIKTNTVTWWSEDSNFIAYLRTNETQVPEYPVQYFMSRPSGQQPPAGEETYPEVRQIKYPRPGSANPVVDLQFYDLSKEEILDVNLEGTYPDDDRIIAEVTWASGGRILARETNREQDKFQVFLIDVLRKEGKVIRSQNLKELDGGWLEPSKTTRYVPADPGNGRPHEGYIDTVINDGYDHLAYYTPLENSEPIWLTSGKWEVDEAPSAVDLKNNLVYFSASKQSSIERHVYSVKLDGSDLKSLVDTTKPGLFSASFSDGAGYMLLTYEGPGIPYQKIVSTPSSEQEFDFTVEENKGLSKMAAEHEMPLTSYQTITIDGVDYPLVERRPHHFSENKKYPVLFHLYQGPNSQTVDRRFRVPFESFVAANLGYIVVELDASGTGFLGRAVRSKIRGNLGYWESHDQIQAAKVYAAKKYVDPDRIGIWGWSYGGFMTLKVLEMDGGETFKYGVAVAPVTDWKLYDSIYTERYMFTPQNNADGYRDVSISNTTALANNVRFMVMHGVADDNVHMQNTLELIDKLDLGGVENYDMMMFPDSDHSIYFHGARRIVYERKSLSLPHPTILGSGLWSPLNQQQNKTLHTRKYANPNPNRRRTNELAHQRIQR